MRKFLHPALLMATTMLLAGIACKGSDPTPQVAFESWLQSVEKCDAVGMRSGLTKSSVEQVEALVKQLQAFVPDGQRGKFDLLNELCKGYRKGAIKVLSGTIDGNNATLKITSDGRPMEAPMSIEDGSWKLDFASLMKQTVAAATASRAQTGTTPAAPPAKPATTTDAPAQAAPAPATTAP